MKTKSNKLKSFAAVGFILCMGGLASADTLDDNLETITIDSDGVVSTQRDLNLSSLDGMPLEENGFHGSFADGEALFETMMDTVHGADERKRVTDTTSFPNRAIGRLALGCTGTLIGPRVVLTAGHCIYDLKTKKFLKDLDFSPGQNAKSYPYGTVKWTHATTTKAYTEQGKTEWDFAVVILKDPIGNSVGYMGYGYNDGMNSGNININGYPSDKEFGTMWHSFCPLKSVKTDLFDYLCDTYKGNSGSAIYQFFAANNERKIVGIHTTGLTDYNYGTRITKAKFEKLKGWKAANP